MKNRLIAMLLLSAMIFSGIVPGNVNSVQASEIIEKSQTADDSEVPDYVQSEAKEVAAKVEDVRNETSFVAGFVSDLHTSGYDQSAVSTLHAGMAMNEIQSLTQLDLMANFGDIAVGKFDESAKKGFEHVKECFADVTDQIPYIQMQGNHDELPEDTTEEARQKYYDYIGANNIGTVIDEENKFRNYGYRDFEEKKKRIIYLNTSDVSDSEITADSYVTAQQLDWFANVALDFSDKVDAQDWTFSVYSHTPLTWYGNVSNLLSILDAYKGKTAGSVSLDGETISYDFTDAEVRFIAHYHGHLHNFRVDKLGVNGVASVTLPNVCFNRNNSYGTTESYGVNVHRLYGDVDVEGNQRQFNKIADTAEDTAFNIVVEDIENEKIFCFNYGAGIDRVVDLEGNVVEPDEEEVLVETYTNQIPLSVNSDGTEFVGENGEDGYKTGYRISVSRGDEVAVSGVNATGYIPVKTGDVIRVKDIDLTETTSTYAIYDEIFTKVSSGYCNTTFKEENADGVRQYVISDSDGYIRIAGAFGENPVITINEDLGHSYEKWIVETEATPDAEGVRYTECINCENRVTEQIEKVQKLALTGASLTLQDNLTINFKTKLSLYRKEGYKNPYVLFNYNGLQSTSKYYNLIDGNYVFDYFNIAPHQMNDTIQATLYADYNKTEYTSETKEYSVAMYCYNMLDKCTADEYAKFRTLLVDLLEYGAKSQIYQNYKTNTLVNENLTEEQKIWGTSEERELQSIQNPEYETIENPAVTWKGAGLNLTDRVEMRFKIAAESNSNLNARLTVESDPEWIQTIPFSMFEATDGGYYLYYKGLNAGQMSEAVYITIYDGDTPVSNTLRYSVESYAYTQMNKENADEDLLSLLRAMMKYGDSANNYVD